MSGFDPFGPGPGASSEIPASLSDVFINIDLEQSGDAASPGADGDFDDFVNSRGNNQPQTHQPQHHHDSQFSAGAIGRVSGGDGIGFQDIDFNAPGFGTEGSLVSGPPPQNLTVGTSHDQDLGLAPANLFNSTPKTPVDHSNFSSNSSLGQRDNAFGFSSNQAALNTANSRLDGMFNSNSGGPKRGVDPATSSMQGELLCRVSTKSMLLKSWKPLFFHLDCREGNLAVFRSQEDLRKGPPFAKKYLKLEYNYRCTEIKLKEYGKSFLYHFSLEEIMDYGPSLKMKFAAESMKRALLENLRAAIHRFVRDRRIKRKNDMLAVRAAQVEGGIAAGGQVGHMKQQQQKHHVSGRYAEPFRPTPIPARKASQDLGIAGLPASPPPKMPNYNNRSNNSTQQYNGNVNNDGLDRFDKWGRL